MEQIRLKTKIPKRVAKGHLLIFSNELESVPNLTKGEIVKIVDKDGLSLGIGFYNPHSLVAIRLLKCSEQSNFANILKARMLEAKKLRERIFPDEECYRTSPSA